MAEKIISTRIINKNGSYDEWKSSELIGKKGEILLCQVTAATSDELGNVVNRPTYLMKVGDGTSKFSDLKWMYAPASDVYAWAKQSTLPVKVEGSGNIVSNVEYTSWTSGSETVYGLKITKNTVATGDDVSQAIETAKAYADGLDAQVRKDFAAADTALGQRIDALAQTHADDKATLESAIEDAQNAGDGAQSDLNAFKTTVSTTYATKTALTEAAEAAQSANDTLATTLRSEITSAKTSAQTTAEANAKTYTDGQISSLKTTLQGEIDADVKTASDALNKKIEDEITARGEIDEDHAGRIESLETKVATLEGTTHFAGADILANRPASADEGDVFVATDNGKEYIFAKGAWVELGDTSAELERISALETFRDTTVPATYVTKSAYNEKIEALEAADSTHATEYNALKGRVDGHDTAIENLGKEDVRLAALISANDTAIKANADAIAALDATYVNNTELQEAIDGVKSYSDGELSDAISDLETAYKAADQSLATSINGVSGRVTNIENDYLKAADKNELNTSIGAVDERVDATNSRVETIETTYIKIANNTAMLGEQVIVFDCGGAN